jgi:hypothetical protein
MMTTHRRSAPVEPTGLPLLSAGLHLNPEDGACLMEYTSVLAGQRFTDHPGCTDPTLATLARLVNDAISDDGRPRLAALAPRLAVAPRTDAVGAAALVLSTVRHVQHALGGTRLERHVAGAERWLRHVSGEGLPARVRRRLEPAHRRGSARRRLVAAVDATADLPGPERDALLCAVLDAALDAHARSPEVSPARHHDPGQLSASGR